MMNEEDIAKAICFEATNGREIKVGWFTKFEIVMKSECDDKNFKGMVIMENGIYNSMCLNDPPDIVQALGLRLTGLEIGRHLFGGVSTKGMMPIKILTLKFKKLEVLLERSNERVVGEDSPIDWASFEQRMSIE